MDDFFAQDAPQQPAPTGGGDFGGDFGAGDAPAAPPPALNAGSDAAGDMMGGGVGGDMMGGGVGDDMMGAPTSGSPTSGDDFGGMMGGGGGGGDMMGGGGGDMGGSVDMGMPLSAPVAAEVEANLPAVPVANGGGVGLEAANFASSALAQWNAEQQRVIAEKEAEEKRELQTMREEAQAERELLYSQREKQLQAVYKSNRERQAATEQTTASQTGWEAVVNLLSDENLVPDKHTDLSRFKQMLTRLKHQQPLTAM